MPIDRKIFISAATQEFEKHRNDLLRALSSLAVEVRTQESLKSTGGTTFDTIDDYIQAADYVVHLAGAVSGSSAPKGFTDAMFARYPDMLTQLPQLADADLRSISYTQWEANLALLHKKRLFCFAPTRILESFHKKSWLGDLAQRDHIHRLIKQLNRHPEPFDDLNHLLASIAILTNQLYRGGELKIVEERIDPKLPYFVNRTGHLRKIFDCISVHPFFQDATASDISPDRNSPHRAAHLFVFPGEWHDDAPDALIRRLTGHDGPSRVGATGERDAVGWVDSLLKWPSDTTPMEFAGAFLADNRKDLKEGIEKAVKRVQPVCFHNHWIGIDDHRRSLDFVRAWVAFWGKNLGELIQQFTGKDVSNFGVPILAFLSVDPARAGKRSYRIPFVSRPRDLSQDVESLIPEMARTFPTITLSPLGRLPKINVQDARDWLRQCIDDSRYRRPQKRIEQMEKEDVFPMSIKVFAESFDPK